MQSVQPLKVPTSIKIPAIHAHAKRKISRRNCKGVLVQEGQEFHILKLFGSGRTARDLKGEDKVWVFIPEKGTIQLAWSDIESAIDDSAKCDTSNNNDNNDGNGEEDDNCSGAIFVFAVSEGYVRPQPQKVGTRLRTDTKLLHCYQLDFGSGLQDSNKWLWVESSALLGEAQPDDQSQQAQQSQQLFFVPSSPTGVRRGSSEVVVVGQSHRRSVVEDVDDSKHCHRHHRHHHRRHHSKKDEDDDDDDDDDESVVEENGEDDDDVERGADNLLYMFRSRFQ